MIFFVIDTTYQKHEQHQALTARALGQEREVVGVFAVEQTHSAMGFFHAIDACDTHGATIVMVDRAQSLVFLRHELTHALERLLETHVILEVGETQLDFSELQLFLDLIKQSEQKQKELRSESIKTALKSRVRQGQKLGGRKYGATRAELRVIQQIVKLHEQGKSLTAICLLLEHNKIATAHKKSWHPMTVKRLIDEYYNHTKRI